jgi:hypothetical protein
VISRSRTRYQPEPNPVQPIFLTTDPTGCRHARLPIETLMHHAECTLQQKNLPRNLAGTRQSIRPQPSRQSVPLPCHISTDALLRSGGIRRKRIWRVTSKLRSHSLSCCTAQQFDVGQFADNLTTNDLYTAPEGFKSWHETGKAWAMMHQMKFEDPDGFRRTPVSAPLPRRGTDAGRRRGQSAVSSLYSAIRPGRSQWPRVERRHR